jgi:hypothetical protein
MASAMNELESCFGVIGTPLPDIDVEAVVRMILEHHRRLQMEEYTQGEAQLAATILNVTKNERATAGLLMHYHTRLQPYRADDKKMLLNDLLVLSDIMTKSLPDLCTHLNAGGVDAVDLADVVGSWCLALFASYFPSYTVLRTLDLMLFETHDCVIAVAFGILKVMKSYILSNTKEVFVTLTNMPNFTSDTEVDAAFKCAYEMLQNEHKYIAQLRREKDWAKALVRPGPLRFVPHVGDPNAEPPPAPAEPESKRGNAMPRGTSQKVIVAKDEKKETSRETVDQPIDYLELPDVIFGLEKMRGKIADPHISRLIEEASREIRKQHEAIVSLKVDLKEHHETTPGSDASSIASSESASDDDEVASPRAGTTLALPTSPTHKHKLPEGTVRHSKLFQYQQFPCLYMEGYLLKARKHGRTPQELTASVVHRRFFVLQGSFLTYFKSHRSSKPPRDMSVALRGRQVRQLPPNTSKLGFGFAISNLGATGDLYLLFAGTADERNVWMQVLIAASEAAE